MKVNNIEKPTGAKLALGIDVGTTSLSASVVELDGKTAIETFNLDGSGFIDSSIPNAKLQDPDAIFDKAKSLIDSILGKYAEISAIGITGQMHGILYCDKDGKAVSPLATWQDGRADLPTKTGGSYCDEIFAITGRRVFPGYGLATHYYNLKNSLVPQNAVSLCTVMDYLAMRLCGLDRPISHVTNAHSLGLFDTENGVFDVQSIIKLGIDEKMLPRVTAESEIVGSYSQIPVAVAIGDNQASFLGAIDDEESSVLANYGTGSQISCVSTAPHSSKHIECRPYVDGQYLLCGSALCGGRAYAILERFFNSFCRDAFGDGKSKYDALNKLASEGFGKIEPLDVCTKFSGERADPDLRGSIMGLSEENFTPAALTLGVLYGMARELEEMYREMNCGGKDLLVTSGNVARKNPVFSDILADVFGMEVTLTEGKEEAATGAAKFASTAT